MIVKNESQVIERCLSSTLPLIDYWVIVDTGSTDRTQKIIQRFLKKIPGELHQREWVNFEHNRNEALQLAKGKGDYLLFIDADEVFEYEKDFKLPKLDKDFYYINTHYAGLRYRRVQLIKNSLNWKWVGVVHEYLHCPNIQTIGILDRIVNVPRSEGCRSQDPNKFQNDAKILEEALVKEPNNSRYVFYLAQSYRDAGMLEKAAENYKKRIDMKGWDQEVFWSLYQVARIKEALNQPYQEVIDAYLNAYRYQPSRAEPLYELSRFLRQKGHNLMSYLIADFALGIPQPSDGLFLETWAYDYGLLLEKSIAAYWIGRFEECSTLSHKILEKQDLPENVRNCVKKNIEWAILKIPQASKKARKKT